MTIVTLEEAASRLGELIDRATSGEEIVLARDGRQVAQILPWKAEPPAESRPSPRPSGQLRDTMWIAPDFDEWPDDIAEALGMKDS
jgi:antitoxin (DNA-binding transcriptional repressor) of toxin-antitoxin stability system